MIIKEYQLKQLFKKAGVPLPKGQVAYTAEEAQTAAEEIGGNAWMVKAQVPLRSRSNGRFLDLPQDDISGICWANSPQMVAGLAEQMLGKTLITPESDTGYAVRRVYVEEACMGRAEYKLSLRIDFLTQKLMLTVFAGNKTKHTYELMYKKTPQTLLRQVVRDLRLKDGPAKDMQMLIQKTADLFYTYEAVAVELDPILESNGRLIVLDGQIVFNDDSLFRFPEIESLHEREHLNDPQIIAYRHQFRYTKMDGNIACLVNGIGLGQATIDMIRAKGGQPSCLLDVGTEPSQDAVARALKLALSDPDVDGVLVNIFGGITRCDIIVQGLLAAAGEILAGLPVVVRMDGTNANIGHRLLFESRLPFTVIKKMDEAVSEIIRQVKELD